MLKENNNYPIRKHPRLKNYDYSQNGSYHITICTKNKECLLGKVVFNQQASDVIKIHLSPYGIIVDKYIQRIDLVYKYIKVDKYVIMPNHIHLLLSINQPLDVLMNKNQKHVNVETVVRTFKRMVTREVGKSIWQESFYDTVLEDDHAYYSAYEYIENNPVCWIADKYYSE